MSVDPRVDHTALGSRARAFFVVGALGFIVQLVTFGLLVKLTPAALLIASAASVIAAVVHNFVWHARWTWSDRRDGHAIARLARFALVTGTTSLASNLLLVSVLAAYLRLDPALSATVAVAVTSIVNYVSCDRFVFRRCS